MSRPRFPAKDANVKGGGGAQGRDDIGKGGIHGEKGGSGSDKEGILPTYLIYPSSFCL